ncbi:MAG: hypothetical protein ACRCSC_01820 [Lactococcus garvieae]
MKKEELIEALEKIIALERTVSLDVFLHPIIDDEIHYPSQRVGLLAHELIQSAKTDLKELKQK